MSTKYEQVEACDDNDIKEGMSDILIVCHLFILLLPLLFYFYYITHREITISGVVPKLKSDKTTPDRAWTFERRSLFDVETVCNRCRRTRGSRCARFEVHTMVGREDTYNSLLLVCFKGGAL